MLQPFFIIQLLNNVHSKVARSFRPDFVLIRQAPRDGSRDFRSTLLGLKYGGVPCINSLNSIYQFQVCLLPFRQKTNSLIQEMSSKATEQLSKSVNVWLLLGSLCACCFTHHLTFLFDVLILTSVMNKKFKNFVFFIQDKPWIFAHLLQLQRRQGRDAFPLIEQTFFPNAKDLVSTPYCNYYVK